jgi:HTH-type transcriptional regulator, sugar sensing transcriptional regulator
MEELLTQIGLHNKEQRCFLALLEFGQQPGSVVAKKLGMPKATVLFTLNGLVERGFVLMSKRGKTQYYYTDAEILEKAKANQIEGEKRALNRLTPLLKEYKNPLTSPPKVTFFEGAQACKEAYSDLLNSKTEILEFTTHDDLVDKFGEKWMDDFVHERAKRNIFIKSMCNDTETDRSMEPLDEEQCRKTSFIPGQEGMMYSCISLYDDRLLMMNLSGDCFGILIQNAAIVETMKVVHGLAWR